MAIINLKIPSQFIQSMNKFMDQVNQFAKMSAQFAFISKTAQVSIPTSTPQSGISGHFNQIGQHLTRFERILRYSTDRVLSVMGPRVRAFVYSARMITDVLDVSNFVKMIKVVPVVGRFISISAVGGPIGMAISTVAITISAIVGVLRWMITRFSEFYYKDLLESRTIGASIGGLRAFRISFSELGEDPVFMSAMATMRADRTSAESIAIRKLLRVKANSDVSEMMVQTVLAMQKWLQERPLSEALLPESQMLKAASPQFILRLREMTRQRAELLARRYAERRSGLEPSPESRDAWLKLSRDFGVVYDTTMNRFGELLVRSGVVNALISTSKWFAKNLEQTPSIRILDLGPLLTIDLTTQMYDNLSSIKKMWDDLFLEFPKWIAWIKKQIDKLKHYMANALVTSAQAEAFAGPTGLMFRPGIGSGRGPYPTSGRYPTGPMFRPGIRPGMQRRYPGGPTQYRDDTGKPDTSSKDYSRDNTGKPLDPATFAQAEELARTGDVPGVYNFIRSQGYHVDTNYCGDFVGAVIKAQGGTPVSGFPVATSWLNYGTPVKPGEEQPGDIAIYPKGHPAGVPGGHVGFVGSRGVTAPGQFQFFGANTVRESVTSESGVVFRRPPSSQASEPPTGQNLSVSLPSAIPGGRLPTAAELANKSVPAGERFNNPFNMWFDKYAAQQGGVDPKLSITQYDSPAAFPSKLAGAAAAIRKMAYSPLYSGKTMQDLIAKWVDHGESYAPIIEQMTGISRTTKITPEFLQSEKGLQFLKAMARYETKVERPYPLTDNDWRLAQKSAFSTDPRSITSQWTSAPPTVPAQAPESEVSGWLKERLRKQELDHGYENENKNKIEVTNHGSPNGTDEDNQHNGGSLEHGLKIENRSDHDVKLESDSNIIVPTEKSRPDVVKRPGHSIIPANQKTIEAKPAPPAVPETAPPVSGLPYVWTPAKTPEDPPAAIRFKNPGAIYPSPSAAETGATGYTILRDPPRNKIAIYPDPELGAAGQFKVLSNVYASKKQWTIAQAMGEYTGHTGGQAQVNKYVEEITKATGLPPNTIITKEMLAGPLGIAFVRASQSSEAGKTPALDIGGLLRAQKRAFEAKLIESRFAETDEELMLMAR